MSFTNINLEYWKKPILEELPKEYVKAIEDYIAPGYKLIQSRLDMLYGINFGLIMFKAGETISNTKIEFQKQELTKQKNEIELLFKEISEFKLDR